MELQKVVSVVVEKGKDASHDIETIVLKPEVSGINDQIVAGIAKILKSNGLVGIETTKISDTVLTCNAFGNRSNKAAFDEVRKFLEQSGLADSLPINNVDNLGGRENHNQSDAFIATAKAREAMN